MGAYQKFALVYDLFMDNAPYDDWTAYILALWERLGVKPGLVLDLACGTGNMTVRLAEKGCDMIGVDRSAEMLTVAQEKSQNAGLPILYLCQDMCAFELYGTVDAVVCICDGVNYLTEDGQLSAVLKLVKNYLNPGGYFIFDINTEHKFKHILSENTYAEIRENEAYIWENFYDAADRIHEYRAAFFMKNAAGLYERFDELHYERAYTVEEIGEAVARAGLELTAVYDDLTFHAPRADSERIFFVVRRA